MRIQNHKKISAGFGLAECMISIAISGSALLAVIGLLAGGLGSASDAKTETMAGMLSRRLVLEARQELAVGPILVLPLTRYFVWDSAMQTMESSLKTGGGESEYKTGSSKLAAALVGRYQLTQSLELPGMLHVEILIETPAAAPAGQRKVHRYETIISAL